VRLLPLDLAGDPEPDQYRWRAADGRQHVYLGDYDSYLWLRRARAYLRTGTVCDEVVDGVCRDTHAPAPVGRRMRYGRTLHVLAIAAVHRLATAIDPGWPLPSSAYLVPVIVGVLGVLPAFAIGARLAGSVGGFTAAVVIGTDPLFLFRSAGGDNDVWNVVLPLCAVWGVLAALAADTRRRRVAGTLAAATATGLHAATWSGWVFGAAVVLGGLALVVVLRVLRAALGREPADRRAAVAAVQVLLGFAVAAALAAALAGGGAELRALPARVAATLRPSPAPVGVPWPDVLATVGELRAPSLTNVAVILHGWLYFGIASLGLLLALVPLAGGGTIVALWFLAALWLALRGERFVMLLVPPFGLLVGVALGRVHGWVARAVAPRVGRGAPLARAGSLALVAVLVGIAVHGGRTAARNYRPFMHDAWWDTFARLRAEAPPDAIVHSWWDWGHWAAYLTERRVTADGAGLGTHVPHWIARALLAPTERETVGLLRMLACGSDATPEPEGRLGAFGKLVATGMDPGVAHETIVALAGLDRDAARARLRARGLDEATAEDVLRSTHCTPPAQYLVLSTRMLDLAGWRRLGSWDPRRAAAVELAGERGPEAASGVLAARFGLSLEDAWPLAAQAAMLSGEAARDFVAPDDGYLSREWLPCREEAGAWSCPIGVPVDAAGTVLAALRYRPDAPGESRLVLHGPGGTERGLATPAALLVAGPERLDEIAFATPTYPMLAALVDVAGRRVLLGRPYLIRSTFTQLVYLDGRYAERLAKFDDRTGARGERVVTWRIDPHSGCSQRGCRRKNMPCSVPAATSRTATAPASAAPAARRSRSPAAAAAPSCPTTRPSAIAAAGR
jgi:dolichyl-phosphooligosaccharide-protein glycotransferase